MKGGLKELEMAVGFECTCNHPQLTLLFFSIHKCSSDKGHHCFHDNDDDGVDDQEN